MLWALVAVLAILWFFGFVVFNVGGMLIHLLLIVAVIVVLYNLVTVKRL